MDFDLDLKLWSQDSDEEVVPFTQQEDIGTINLDDKTHELIFSSLPRDLGLKETKRPFNKHGSKQLTPLVSHDFEDSEVDSMLCTPKRLPLTPLLNISRSMYSPSAGAYKGKKPDDVSSKKVQVAFDFV
ncbi:hypothetical protein L7F22_026362 [Adiantum nelumboides]|nr:hypothetical protein [Adiantum nelumboides]